MPEPPSEWTVLSMLEWATSYFEEKEIRNPRYSIEWLLADVLDVKRLDLYLLFDRPLSLEEREILRPLVKRRAQHEPLQYITGSTDFFNTTIKVAPGVLIPRMETEQLVEIVLERYKDQKKTIRLLDIGTGSGCIPIALKKARPEWDALASDISEQALKKAKENADLNEVQVSFVIDDILNTRAFESSELFDLIISNPPYILYEEKQKLDREVKNYEPEHALFCNSISEMYSSIRDFALRKLSKKGSLYLELHEDHADEVLGLFEPSEWTAKVLRDYDKKDRFLVAEKI